MLKTLSDFLKLTAMIFGLSAVFSTSAFAWVVTPSKETKKVEEAKTNEIKNVLELSGKKNGIAFEVKKTAESDLLGSSLSEGRLILKQGKMKLELKGADNNEMFFNGKTIWVVQRSQFKKKDVQVMTGKVSVKNKSMLVLKSLESWSEFQKNFSVEEVKTEGDKVTAKLKLLVNDIDIKDIYLQVDSKSHQVQFLKYSDNGGNQVSFQLEEKKEVKKIKDSEFNYSIPKGAKVTQI